MITITESAAKRISEIREEDHHDAGLRVFVRGGGCSGFQYGFTLDEVPNEDDFIIEKLGLKILVDSMSMHYLQGASIDYIEEVMSSQFVIKNPNAQSTCGCGSSFTV